MRFSSAIAAAGFKPCTQTPTVRGNQTVANLSYASARTDLGARLGAVHDGVTAVHRPLVAQFVDAFVPIVVSRVHHPSARSWPTQCLTASIEWKGAK